MFNSGKKIRAARNNFFFLTRDVRKQISERNKKQVKGSVPKMFYDMFVEMSQIYWIPVHSQCPCCRCMYIKHCQHSIFYNCIYSCKFMYEFTIYESLSEIGKF
jgi:hypothetical protein